MRILYIDIDCLRPDHLGCYGYVRNTSPTIDGIAKRGARFTNCFTTDAPCLPSRAALFSGRPGIENGVVAHEGPGANFRFPGDGHDPDPERPMWMEALSRNGMNTVSFSSFARRHMAWWFIAGFTEFYGNRFGGGHETADQVNAEVLPWLEQNAREDNWFLHVHYWDVHTPYRAPQKYWDEVSSQPAPEWPDEDTIKKHCDEWYGPRTARDFFGSMRTGKSPFPTMRDAILDRDDYISFVNGYDAGLRFVDDAVAEILQSLERAGVREDTAIIVSGDHGEAVGEQGMYFEHGNSSEGIAHIPLIIDWPGMPGGVVADGITQNLDLPATMVDLLGIDKPAKWEGNSFADALRGKDYLGREYTIWGCGIYSFQRAVRTKDWLFVRTLHCGNYPHEPVMLYNIKDDPWQQHNLVHDNPAKAAEMDYILSNWWHEHCSGPGSVRDPFQTTMATGPDIYCSVERTEWMIERANRPDQLEDLRRRRNVEPFKFRPGAE